MTHRVRTCPHDELLTDPCSECEWDADDGYAFGERMALADDPDLPGFAFLSETAAVDHKGEQ